MSQIKLFYKNHVDIDNSNVALGVTDTAATDDGANILEFIRNRNNNSAWLTTGSADANNTTIDVDMADSLRVDTVILVGHNFKSFTIQYWDSGWVDFSTPINETSNIDGTTSFTFDEVTTSRIKLIITGTQVADDDKILKQLIVVKTLRTLDAFPEIVKPSHSRTRSIAKMLSGKSNFVSQVGGFKVDLKVKYWKNDGDLEAVEAIYTNRLPVLVWLCGGDDEQFSSKRIGYRKEDLYLMRPANDYTPEWYSYVYTTGLNLTVKLVEVVN